MKRLNLTIMAIVLSLALGAPAIADTLKAPIPVKPAPPATNPATTVPTQPAAKTPAPKITTVPAQVRADSANEALAQEMKNARRDATAVAAALKMRGASAQETALILKKVFNLTDAGANAAALKAAGYTALQISEALKGGQTSPSVIYGPSGGSQTGPEGRGGIIIPVDLCTTAALRVSGQIWFENCTPGNPKLFNIRITRKHLRCTTSLPSTITVKPVAAGAGIYRYNVDQQAAAGQYTIDAAIVDRNCAVGGMWRAENNVGQPTSNFSLGAAGATPAIHNFSYLAPTAVRRIPVTQMAQYLAFTFSTIRMRFNNKGPRNGNGFYKPRDAYIEYLIWNGTRLVPARKYISIPEVRFDIDAGGPGLVDWLTPDAGDALFYVNDINLQSTAVVPVGGDFRLEYVFEGQGAEVKGYFKSTTTGVEDSGMPDVDINGMKLVARLSLTAVNGLLGYKEVGATMFEGTIVICPGICNKALDAIFGYNGILRRVASAEFEKGLNRSMPDFSSGFTALFDPASQLSPIAPAHRFKGQITSVSIVGSDVVIYYVDTAR